MADLTITSSKYAFWDYLKTQRKNLIIAGISSLVCFIVLKFCFPLPDIFNDSLNYILWTKFDTNVQYRPVGYTIFLKYVHDHFAESINMVVVVQYLAFFLSSLFCGLSADYLFGIPGKFRLPALLLTVVNPVLLFLVNYISSDSLFCSLTVFWFGSCLWIIRRHSWWALVLQILFLYLAFQVRYTALFFPLIAVVTFLSSKGNIFYKTAGIALTIFVIQTAISKQSDEVETTTGTRVFSGFSGWQMANNVLYYYKKINVDTTKLPSPEITELNRMVLNFIDSVPKKDTVGSIYLWHKKSPLKVFVYTWAARNRITYFKEWFAASVVFNEYATHIIKNNPGAFVKYFIVPNTGNFFYPEPEILEDYNCTKLGVDTFTERWYHTDHAQFVPRYPRLEHHVMSVFPFVSLLLNIFNIGAIIVFFVWLIQVWRKTPVYIKGLFITWSVFYFAYMGFSIFATVVTLRYLAPIYVMGFIMPLLLLGYNKARIKELALTAAKEPEAPKTQPKTAPVKKTK